MDSKPKSGGLDSQKIIYIIAGVLLIGLAAVAVYFYIQYQNIKKNPNQVAKAETDALVAQVSKLIDLPKDETPTVATVLDKEKLKDQPFFAGAENGDKILIYTKAKKAIIYRPKDNKLINVGPIAIDQKAQLPIAIVNAGGDSGAVESKLNNKFTSGITIVSKTDAKNRNSVKKVTVVDVSGQNAEAAKQIAAELGGEVGSLPAGETAPQGASIVVFAK
ncbi:MAG: hypothetical protein E6Q36_07860 [Chryseobacterium sp.]|nr:MAG: hypothetical protein E6Q36_07860 [Chryseobacterium sp.]